MSTPTDPADLRLALHDAQLALQQCEERLRETTRLKDGLVQMVVNDMRSPLHVIMHSTSVLKRELAAQLPHPALDDLQTASDRLSCITNDLLDITRLEAGHMPLHLEDCDIGRITESVVQVLTGLTPTLRVQFTADARTTARGDQNMVYRVVENLFSNALKHSPDDQPIRVSVVEAEDGVRVNVRDQGAGIAPGFRETIFEQFATLTTDAGRDLHSGDLGLAFCKIAVLAQGGQIGVESEPGEGSTFWFTLPNQ
jgi:signal transduction histidine kinase